MDLEELDEMIFCLKGRTGSDNLITTTNKSQSISVTNVVNWRNTSIPSVSVSLPVVTECKNNECKSSPSHADKPSLLPAVIGQPTPPPPPLPLRSKYSMRGVLNRKISATVRSSWGRQSDSDSEDGHYFWDDFDSQRHPTPLEELIEPEHLQSVEFELSEPELGIATTTGERVDTVTDSTSGHSKHKKKLKIFAKYFPCYDGCLKKLDKVMTYSVGGLTKPVFSYYDCD
ncbi:hypothetical protein Ciccas_007778 [Cichlidogyrus casuarinus]|uniref:Uncharacterized protein n=1 Tax=Cichlidogyrus casuarinus TaxID=1844966 RepID=A0ABD2Q1W4_9PLAT